MYNKWIHFISPKWLINSSRGFTSFSLSSVFAGRRREGWTKTDGEIVVVIMGVIAALGPPERRGTVGGGGRETGWTLITPEQVLCATVKGRIARKR